MRGINSNDQESQINYQCCTAQTQLFTCTVVCVCVCPTLTQFTQLGNYILQMSASQGERAKVTGGKYYCSADLCLKVCVRERPAAVTPPPPPRPQDISSPIRESAHEHADDDGGGLTQTPSRFLCVCIKNNWNNNNNNRKKKKKSSPLLLHPGQDHKVSI